MAKKKILVDNNASIKDEDISWVYDFNTVFVMNEPSSVIGTVEVVEFELPESEEHAILTSEGRERTEKAYPKLSRIK